VRRAKTSKTAGGFDLLAANTGHITSLWLFCKKGF
jgi:hypothetical protein